MSVAAFNGTPSLTYQWQFSTKHSTFTDIAGATSTSYTTPVLTTTTYYRVMASSTGNGCGSATSNTATVTVVPDPSITVQPVGATVCVNSFYTLSVTATGGTPSLTYQWFSSPNNSTWTAVVGGTNSTLPLAPLAYGTTYYRVTISATGNGCNSVTSNSVSVVTNCGEICNNNTDDDGDGKPDCFDSDCPCFAPVLCDQTMYQTYELVNNVAGQGSDGD